MENLLLELFTQHQTLASVLVIIGACRVINKPLFALFHAVVDVTKTEIDNEWLKKLEESKPYKVFLFILDYVGSVKVK